MALRITAKSGIDSQVVKIEFPAELPRLPAKLKTIDPKLQDYEDLMDIWYTELRETLTKHLENV